MIWEIFKRATQSKDRGFALPTVMISSIVMLLILITSVQASASVRTALTNQYYDKLATAAVEAGTAFANACIQNSKGYASWSELKPNTDCTGKGIGGVTQYLVDKTDIRSTFTVSINDVYGDSASQFDPYKLTVTGTVQLLRKSNGQPWKTTTTKRNTKVEPCYKTVTNLISNPSFETNTTGWSPYSGTNIARTTNAASPPTTDGNYTLLVQSTGSNESFAESALALEAGKTYTVSGVLHRPGTTWPSSGAHARRLSIAVFAYIPSSGTYFEALAQSTSTDPGHRRVSKTFTVPTNATTTFMRLYNGATSDIVYWDSIMLAQDDKDTGFKDGDTKGWAWNGTYDNSTSVGPVKTECTTASSCSLTNLITNPNIETSIGTIPSGSADANTWTPVNATAVRDTTTPASSSWKLGLGSLKITPSASSNGDSFASIGGDSGAIRLGMQPGKTYTISASVYVPQTLSGAAYVPLRRAAIVIHTYNASTNWNFFTATPNYGNNQYNQSTEPTNTAAGSYSTNAGLYNLKTTFTIPSSTTQSFVRLYNGGKPGEPPVFWDNVALYEGARAPYYDGTSPDWAWSGAANLSTSTGLTNPCSSAISY